MEEGAEGGREVGGLVWDQGAGVFDLDQVSVGKEVCEAAAVVLRHHRVLVRPDDQRRLGEAAQVSDHSSSVLAGGVPVANARRSRRIAGSRRAGSNQVSRTSSGMGGLTAPQARRLCRKNDVRSSCASSLAPPGTRHSGSAGRACGGGKLSNASHATKPIARPAGSRFSGDDELCSTPIVHDEGDVVDIEGVEEIGKYRDLTAMGQIRSRFFVGDRCAPIGKVGAMQRNWSSRSGITLRHWR